MPIFRKYRPWFLLASIICSIALFTFNWSSRTSGSLSKKVRAASAIDSKPTLRDVVSGRRPIGTVRVGDVLSSDDIYLRLGSSRLEWSYASQNSGYLYCASTDIERGPWEFALASKRELNQLLPEDAKQNFYGNGDPKGTNDFGAKWLYQNQALQVKVGDLLFARQANVPTIVYALKLKSQNDMKLQVEYLEMKMTDE